MSALIDSLSAPRLSLTFVGNGENPIACCYSGQSARVDSFDLVERAVLRALCVDVIRALDEHEHPLLSVAGLTAESTR